MSSSSFKTIKQQSAEKVIDAMFAGLQDDISLKTALEVMYGLRPESDLEILARVNEENLKTLSEKMCLQCDASGNLIEIISTDNVNGNS